MCPRGVFLTVMGHVYYCKNRDQRFYIVEPSDLHFYTGENDRRLVYISRPPFSRSTDDRSVTRPDSSVNEPQWARASAGARSPAIGSKPGDRLVT